MDLVLASSLRFTRRPGIARNLAMVAVAVLAASVVAGAAVFSMSQTPSPSGSAPSSVSATTSSSASTAATSTSSRVNLFSTTTSSGSTSSSSIPCLLNSTGTSSMAQLNATVLALVGNLTGLFNQGQGNVTVAQLFGNFSQMAVSSEITGNLSLATSSSYQVVARPMIGSLEYYEVNFTLSTAGFNDSQVIMFAPNGTATSVSSPLLGSFTGASAAAMGEGDVSSFLIQLHSSSYAGAIQSDPSVAVLNSTTVSIGPTQVKMTYYTLKSLPLTYCGTTLSRLVEGLGTVQKTGLTFLMYGQAQVTEQGTTMGVTTSVESLTLAGP